MIFLMAGIRKLRRKKLVKSKIKRIQILNLHKNYLSVLFILRKFIYLFGTSYFCFLKKKNVSSIIITLFK